MPWFKVDDNLAFHAKTMRAGNAAMGLWVRAGSWAAHQLTDGFIPDHICTTLGTRAQAKKLVSAGLWTQKEGGYEFHQWSDRQPTRGEVTAERDANRERMRRARAARKGTTKSEQNSQESASSQVSEPRAAAQTCSCGRCAENVQPVCGQPDPVPVPVPVPTQSPISRRAKQLPDDWQPSEKHQELANELRVDITTEAAKFADYCHANGKTYKDHDRAFNNWLRNAKQFAGRPTRQQEVDEVYQRAMARARGEQQ